jgi:hypothetical protein
MKPETQESSLPRDYYSKADYPIGGNHPDYPDIYRVTVADMQRAYEDDMAPHSCCECPMKQDSCDRSCGFGKIWVGAVTWIRIRMMEAQQ